MAISRRQRFVYGQVAWMVGVVLVFSVTGVLSLQTFFVGSLLGFLALLDATNPINVSPAWRKRLRWVVLLGFLGFGYVVVQRLLGVFSEMGF